MKIHYKQYFFDFKKMYTWADFDLRMNHAMIQRNPHPKYRRPDHVKPNLCLIAFWEIRYHKGNLKMWNVEDKQWQNVFPHAEELQRELTKLYEDYMFETTVLK